MILKKYIPIYLLLFILLLGFIISTQHNSSQIIHITEKEINSGYVINKPGTYIIDSDINWSVSVSDSFAITIASNNVILEGNNKCIKQLNSTVKHAIGIQIKEGYKDICIQDIQFDSISGGGIWFRGNNSNITINNIKTSNCGYFGMTQLNTNNQTHAFACALLFNGSHDKPINNVHVIDCTFAETG